MNKKVFIVAVPEEVEAQGNILNTPVIFSGIGKINATIAAMTAFNLGYNEIINIGSEPLQLYTIYTPPEHEPSRIDKIKP